MFADPKFVRLITEFEIEQNDEIRTHKVLKCQLNLGELDREVRKYRTTESAAEKFEEKVQKVWEEVKGKMGRQGMANGKRSGGRKGIKLTKS